MLFKGSVQVQGADNGRIPAGQQHIGDDQQANIAKPDALAIGCIAVVLAFIAVGFLEQGIDQCGNLIAGYRHRHLTGVTLCLDAFLNGLQCQLVFAGSFLHLISAGAAVGDSAQGDHHPALKGLLAIGGPLSHDSVDGVFITHRHLPTVAHQ